MSVTTVGATTSRLLCNLTRPEKPQDKTLDELTELMKNHCEPKTIVIAERFRFYKRVQKEGENVASYLAELGRLSKKCDFHDYLNTATRDQFVCRLYFEAAQQKMVAESELGLDKAISMAQAYESARRETQSLRGETLASQARLFRAVAELTAHVNHTRRRSFTGIAPAREEPGRFRECHSDWAAPIVVVRRGDGSLRICGDYKVTVNPYLEMNTYTLPNPQDLFATLAGGRYFS